MTKSHKILILILTAAALFLILPDSCVIEGKQYEKHFSQINPGQSKQDVINIMGEASKIRSCNFPVSDFSRNIIGNCNEMMIYSSFFSTWTVVLDKDERVIEKFNWFLDESGKRPPDLLN